MNVASRGRIFFNKFHTDPKAATLSFVLLLITYNQQGCLALNQPNDGNQTTDTYKSLDTNTFQLNYNQTQNK